MSKHNYKKVLTGVALSCTLFSAATQAADDVYRLKLAETWGANTPILGETTQKMAALADTMSNGRLKITIDSANKHKAPFGVFDMVRAGQYDIGHSASYYWKGKVPNALYFTTMPFGMTTPEQYGWFYFGEGQALANEVFGKYNMYSFPGGNTGVQMGGWFQKEINSLDDVQGLKIRIPGFAGEIWAQLGAKPTNIAPGDLYTALERKTVDAVEWVGPSLDIRMGFHKIAPFYYTGWHEPASELQFMVNKKAFDRLPEDLQAILKTAMRTAAYDMYIQSYHESAVSWAKMKEEHPDIQVKTFPADVLAAMHKANDALLEQAAKDDPMAQRIQASQAEYMAKARGWTKIADQAYLNSLSD
ncbi:TRAP transporter substrate-binding protein [Neptuniibacter halophilus]|uniref:TRAP transporter substrate-binding protein n=1 Tax=Neptuniibacter halophilus TaxID=651666 RepID=UPI002573EDBC|nr:TRAP transporter substrate-binding protein [Neptuniibacter halophilus]